MEDWFKIINESLKFKMGKNYVYYGLKLKFIVVDEFVVFKVELVNDYVIDGDVDEYLI